MRQTGADNGIRVGMARKPFNLLMKLKIGGHPSIYAGKRSSIQDCSHWCLPGVPDTWNEFLHFLLLSKRGVTS
ncbi:hypothetical protein POTOM_046856 [Populus tomentosa]|uniref:Trichome birefringence-like C-terminal domain-containing protein n=1 Tax=Populus tomentosa TaxID=118781 RepID=A0A8X7YHL4_POPTO|nr:hypothetical protein POTOM_046856 [Populus tomentosa]